jgi:hypothetical protein
MSTDKIYCRSFGFVVDGEKQRRCGGASGVRYPNRRQPVETYYLDDIFEETTTLNAHDT